MPAAAAQDRSCVEFAFRPNFRGVSGKFSVALATRKPLPAAFELDRDDIAFAVVMGAARLNIYVRTDDVHVVNVSIHAEIAVAGA